MGACRHLACRSRLEDIPVCGDLVRKYSGLNRRCNGRAMKRLRKSTAGRRTKSDPAPPEQEENTIIDTDHLLEEVEEDNAQIPDPADRERVIPSRPC